MQLHILPLASLVQAAAGHVARCSAAAVADRGRFTVAFSGGSLPRVLCPPLLAEPLRSQVDWSAWHVFWADERCVPLTHPDSNYRLLQADLLEHVPIPPAQVYPVEVALPPAAAAASYQALLQSLWPPAPGQLPRFDLILLGMGEDGHTASLFSHHPLLKEREQWVAPVFDSPKPPSERVTLTLPVLNNARQVLFLVTGSGKAEVLPRVLAADAPADPLPARMVNPGDGELDWFVDEAAAAKII